MVTCNDFISVLFAYILCNASLFGCNSPKFICFPILHVLAVIGLYIIANIFLDVSLCLYSYSVLWSFGYSLLASLRFLCLLLLQPGSWVLGFAYWSSLCVTSVAEGDRMAILKRLMLFHFFSSLCSPLQQCEYLVFLSSTCLVFG